MGCFLLGRGFAENLLSHPQKRIGMQSAAHLFAVGPLCCTISFNLQYVYKGNGTRQYEGHNLYFLGLNERFLFFFLAD